MKHENRQFVKLNSLLKFPGLQYPEQAITAACRSYPCQRHKMLSNNAWVLLGPDWMVFSEDERLLIVIKKQPNTKKSEFQWTF